MKKISAYQAAALLIISRLLMLSMYIADNGENTLLTAVTAASLDIFKMAVMLPAIYILQKKNRIISDRQDSICAVMLGTGALMFLMILTDRFSSLIESAAPEHFSKLGVTAVVLTACAYTASMGIKAVSRTASLLLPIMTAVFTMIFFELRPGILPDRLNLYSADPIAEISHTLTKLAALSSDIFIMFGVFPYISSRPEKTVKLYLTADGIMTLLFFMTSSSVLGTFSGKTGNVWTVLSYCTHGAVIDRSAAVFLAASTVFFLLTGALLFIILKDSIKAVKNDISDSKLLLTLSAGIALLLATMSVRRTSIATLSLYVCAVSVIAPIILLSVLPSSNAGKDK